MRPLITILRIAAISCRGISKAIQYWPALLLMICILSPISVHVRIPYALSYGDCTYLGTRGIIEHNAPTCQMIAIIDTRPYRRHP